MDNNLFSDLRYKSGDQILDDSWNMLDAPCKGWSVFTRQCIFDES